MQRLFVILSIFTAMSLCGSNVAEGASKHDPRWRNRRFCGPPVVFHPPVRFFAPPLVCGYTQVYIAPRPRPVPLSRQITNAKNLIADQRYESDKLRFARNVAEDLPLKTIDVLDILNMFQYETTKLEYAKFAYDKVEDRENYPTLYQVFEFDSSIKELEAHISK